jgi:hypothetical protein
MSNLTDSLRLRQVRSINMQHERMIARTTALRGCLALLPAPICG